MKYSPVEPSLVAELADNIYALVKEPSPQKAMQALAGEFGHILEFANSKPMMGRTGGKSKIWSTRTGMAVVLKGKGPFKGQLFVVFRGTKILADLLTDGSVTSTKSY